MKKVNIHASVVVLFFLCFAKPAFAGFSFSNPTDYFRSAQTGNWGTLSTWQSSPDNGITPWMAATLIPDNAANTISIRIGHTVTVASSQNMDQVVIESGGILFYSGGVLTVNDGTGDDVIVQGGGVFTLAFAANPPVFSPLTATANINTNAVLRVAATGLTFAAPMPGVNTSNYIYQHASVLEYILGSPFASANVTYFPNVDAVTIPVFRITTNVGLVGSNTNTVFNGLFEANGNITFQSSGTKTFRNGITGTGIVDGSTSGRFIINGLTATLGGTGNLMLPTTAGMDIGNTTSVSMVSNKSVTGNIALLSNALVMLGTFNLTMTGDITGGSATSHIVTNSTGKLIINNIAAVPRIFPIGADNSSINPMAIFNGGGFNYGIRVESGINPAIAVPVQAVNRTWFVTPSGGTPGTVNTNFFYSAGDGNAGFNYTTNLELGLYTTVWNVIQTGLAPAGAYQVATTVNNFGDGIESPLVLANLGAILANNNSVSVDHFSGIKQNNKHVLNWKINCNNTTHVNMDIERSNDGIHFSSIHIMYATALRCQQPFDYTDNVPVAGINYYRIKIVDADGKVFYSSIVALLNAATGFEIISITPNPVVAGNINLKISTAERCNVQFVITDLQGRVLQKEYVNLFAGFNSVLINVSSLSPGMYYITGYTTGLGKKPQRFVIQ